MSYEPHSLFRDAQQRISSPYRVKIVVRHSFANDRVPAASARQIRLRSLCALLRSYDARSNASCDKPLFTFYSSAFCNLSLSNANQYCVSIRRRDGRVIAKNMCELSACLDLRRTAEMGLRNPTHGATETLLSTITVDLNIQNMQ